MDGHLATFLQDYSNLRRVKYFLPLIDLFLCALPEKKLPVNKFHALGSDFDWEGLAQSASSNLFKAESSFLHFWDQNTTIAPNRSSSSLLSSPSGSVSQPDVLHSPQDSLSVRGLDGGNKQGTRRVEIWMDFSPFLSLLYSAFKFYSVERVCGRDIVLHFPQSMSRN